jgi:hypothetical protein
VVVLSLGLPAATAASATHRQHRTASWLVQAGKHFQRAGEYVITGGNVRLQDAYHAYGRPSACEVKQSPNHVVAVWASRGILIDAWTYGGTFPKGENGCISPDLIYVSEIRLARPNWITSLGLHVGDSTVKLRSLYPHAVYRSPTRGSRSEYVLVATHGSCIGVCTPSEQRNGVAISRLSAEVSQGRVVAFWLPVFGEGE